MSSIASVLQGTYQEIRNTKTHYTRIAMLSDDMPKVPGEISGSTLRNGAVSLRKGITFALFVHTESRETNSFSIWQHPPSTAAVCNADRCRLLAALFFGVSIPKFTPQSCTRICLCKPGFFTMAAFLYFPYKSATFDIEAVSVRACLPPPDAAGAISFSVPVKTYAKQ